VLEARQTFRHRCLADRTAARDLPLAATDLELQSENFFYFPHG
jgi:hypothetical protein